MTTPEKYLSKSERFYGMDLLRGVAALMVVLYHLGFNGRPWLVPRGYLAVDFFFILSGFVLARAHEKQLSQSRGRAEFLVQRVLRVYPLYALGSLMGLLVSVSITEHSSTMRIAGYAVAAALFLPYPRTDLLYPLSIVAWSLAMELLVNVAMAFALARLANRWLLAIIGASACGMVVAATLHGSLDVGVGWSTALGGLARVMFGFPAGMVIYRITSTRSRSTRWSALLYVAAFVAALALPATGMPRLALDLPLALLGAPALVYTAARVEVPNLLWANSEVCGLISFPLYAIHNQVLSAVVFILEPRGVISWAVTLLGLLGFALALAHWYDMPTRRILTRRFGVRRLALLWRVHR